MVDVRLAAGAGALSLEQRRALLIELAYTMTGLSAVTAVQVSAGGLPWESDFGTSQVGPSTFTSLSPTNTSAPRVLFTVSDDKLKRLRDPSRWDDLVEVETSVDKPEQIAVRSDLGELAAITGAGTQLQTAADRFRQAEGAAGRHRAAATRLRPQRRAVVLRLLRSREPAGLPRRDRARRWTRARCRRAPLSQRSCPRTAPGSLSPSGTGTGPRWGWPSWRARRAPSA